ncbi:MAG: type IX secretion system protein PorQ [Cytophagales bacterium]
MTRKFCFTANILLAFFANAQLGGRANFEFLNLPTNARQTALGSENISISQGDNNRFFFNPSSIDSSSQNKVGFSYLSMPAQINAGSASYTFKGKTLFWAAGIQFVNYGTFQGRDELGDETNQFKASEFAPQIAVSNQLGNFKLGAGSKLAYSNLAGLTASALLFDVGGSFVHPKKDLVIGMVFKNIGFGLSRYTPNSRITTPFDLQIGSTFKPEHMPVRFSLTLQKLYRYDISYYDPNLGANRGAVAFTEREPDFFDKTIRHLVIGTEFVLSKSFHLLAGYNFLRRKELRVEPGSSGWAGFSFGASLNTKKMNFQFARSIFHNSGALNNFTLNLNFTGMRKKDSVTTSE